MSPGPTLGAKITHQQSLICFCPFIISHFHSLFISIYNFHIHKHSSIHPTHCYQSDYIKTTSCSGMCVPGLHSGYLDIWVLNSEIQFTKIAIRIHSLNHLSYAGWLQGSLYEGRETPWMHNHPVHLWTIDLSCMGKTCKLYTESVGLSWDSIRRPSCHEATTHWATAPPLNRYV